MCSQAQNSPKGLLAMLLGARVHVAEDFKIFGALLRLAMSWSSVVKLAVILPAEGSNLPLGVEAHII